MPRRRKRPDPRIAARINPRTAVIKLDAAIRARLDPPSAARLSVLEAPDETRR